MCTVDSAGAGTTGAAGPGAVTSVAMAMANIVDNKSENMFVLLCVYSNEWQAKIFINPLLQLWSQPKRKQVQQEMPENFIVLKYILQKSYSFQAVYILDSTYAQRYIQSQNIYAKAPVIIQYNHVTCTCRMINVVDTVKLIEVCVCIFFCVIFFIFLTPFFFLLLFLLTSKGFKQSAI